MKKILLLIWSVTAFVLLSTGMGSAITCPGSYSKTTWTNCQSTYIWANGDKYSGEWVDGEQNGQGTYTYADGGKYIGEWVNGESNGQGTETWADGSKYVGEYKDNKRNGQGTFMWGPKTKWSGDKYVGEFKDGKRHGQGTYTYADGDKYVGEWVDGEQNGQGTYTYANGFVEEGIWKDGSFQFAKKTSPKLEGPKQCPSDPSEEYHNCFGTYIYDNGDKYVGEWKNDEENGKGTYYFLADDEFKGDIFEGTFVGGTASGYGKYFFLADNEFKGDVREGTYVDWVLNGPGTYTWEDGSTYNGAFKDSLFDGFGILAVIDGDSYHGNFREGFAEGLGRLLDKDGNLIFEGQFADGEPIDPNQKETPNSQTVQNPEEVVPAASGTGFYVSKNGHIVTNHHVINGCKEIDVIANGESLSTKVVAFDQVNDVALLKVANEPEEYLPISTKRAELLEDIYVAGFPFGNELSSSVKVTRGIVSSLTGFKNNYSQIQIDAAIQQGNSGGPILNSFGNVIGVAVSKADTSFFLEEFDAIPENVNFGVKSSVVLNLLDANGVNIRPPNTEDLSTKTLGQKITKATLYLSCGMTMAQIEAMLTQKAMFNKYK